MVQNLSEILGFSRVVELGSFTAAGRSLGLSTSAMSKQVRALEERLGVRLLNRTTRRVSPTEVGFAFYERAREVLADLEEAELAVTRLQAEPRGRLRISAPMDFGRAQLAPALASFGAEHPDLELDVDLTDRRVDLVAEGFDLVLRIGALEDSSLVARRLAPVRLALCAAPAYLDHHGMPTEPAELAAHDGIHYAFAGARQWPLGPRTGSVTPRRWRHHANNGELMRALALAGQGIALLPTFIVGEDLRAGRLVELLPGAVEQTLVLHAVYPHRKLLSAKVRLFVDHLAARFAGPGGEPLWHDPTGHDPSGRRTG